jgi:hypothetical protein
MINEEMMKLSLKEEKTTLLSLAGKNDGDISPEDAKVIGQKIASMNPEDKKKHLSMVTSLGGFNLADKSNVNQDSIKLRNSILSAYKSAKWNSDNAVKMNEDTLNKKLKTVKLNGYTFYVDYDTKKIYTTEDGKDGTDFKHLTPNEKSQIWNQVHFDKMNEEDKSQTQQQRYVITTDFYVWANSDEEAIKFAEDLAKEQDNNYDDRCKVVSVHLQPQGTMASKLIFGKDDKGSVNEDSEGSMIYVNLKPEELKIIVNRLSMGSKLFNKASSEQNYITKPEIGNEIKEIPKLWERLKEKI